MLQNPIGLSADNGANFIGMFDDWGAEMQKDGRPGATPANLNAFRANMFGGEFVFAVSRDFVRSCTTPLLVLAGNDPFHPTATAREIADLAPNADLLLTWATPDVVGETVSRVRAFLEGAVSSRQTATV